MAERSTASYLLICLFSLVAAWATARPEQVIVLTESEKEWVREHPVIRVANETDWPPFDFYESGVPKGMVIDNVKMLAAKVGLQLEFVSGYTWSELIERFKQRQIDVMPVFYENDERKAFTLYTTSYYTGRLGVFTNTDQGKRSLDLVDQRVGMETSHGSIPLVMRTFPGITITEIDSKAELVRKLATEELDAIIGNPFVFYYHARDNQVNNVQLSSYIEMSGEESGAPDFHIGVRDDWPILHGIMQKALDSVTNEERDAIEREWVDTAIIKKVNWLMVSHGALAILVIVVLLLWHNRKLRILVAAKTQELQRANEGLEEEVGARTHELTKVNSELREALDDLNTLHGILPICSSCKKIRDDEGGWSDMETYVSAHSETRFSHGLCSDCIRELYPEDADRLIKEMDGTDS